MGVDCCGHSARHEGRHRQPSCEAIHPPELHGCKRQINFYSRLPSFRNERKG
jgi:hypothetical protein